MKVFKKVLFILLALSMVCCFVGCPDPNNGPDPDDGSDVVIDGDDSGNEGGNVEGDTPVTPPAGDEGGDVEGDTPATKGTYAWNFQDLNLEGVELTTGTGVAGTNSKFAFADGVTVTYASTPAGLDLILTNGTGGSYNKANTTQSLGSGSEIGSEGAIEPSKVDMVYCELKGPFTAKMIYLNIKVISYGLEIVRASNFLSHKKATMIFRP